jgi:hypothetical protein
MRSPNTPPINTPTAVRRCSTLLLYAARRGWIGGWTVDGRGDKERARGMRRHDEMLPRTPSALMLQSDAAVVALLWRFAAVAAAVAGSAF